MDLINHPACAEYPEGEFDFRVNGESIFILGTDWVPADALHSRDSQRIPAMLDMVDEIGCNAVRCWAAMSMRMNSSLTSAMKKGYWYGRICHGLFHLSPG